MKKKWGYGVVAVCGIVLAGCSTGGTSSTGESSSGSGTAAAEQIFNVVVQQEMPSADLSLATDTISFSALNNVYEGLYRLDADSKPEPAGAAELAEVSEDGLTYKLKLREDAKWSNGEPVTAADYVFGWQRTVSAETGSEYAYLFAPVTNAEAITAGEKDASELGIKAVGDYELEITLTTPTPYFQYLLAFPSFFPQSQAVVEDNGDQYASTSDNAVYNGPFVLAGFDGPGTDTEWSYEKNDQYWDKETVKLDTINVSVVKESSTSLNLFQDGQADDVILTGELAQQMANDEAFVSEPLARTSYIELNQREEDSPFRNEDLRKAISYAIDRDALVTSILGDGSLASTGLIPKGMTFNPTDNTDFVDEAESVIEYDQEKAKEHWEKAKEALGIDSLSFEILASDTDSTKKAIEYIQSAIQDTLDGVKVSLSPVPFSVRLDRSNSGDFDVVMGGWGADYADASSFTDLFVTDNSYNRGRWTSEEYDAAVKSSATTNAGNPDARWQDLLDAEKIIMDQQGVIPVYQNVEAHLRAPKVKGVVSHGAGAQYDYKWAVIEE
ncbi:MULTISPECIES: peptide ABC transporter substrate-binding protein [Enterococcus]|jgi:oligopeptide transport system substrate-binding protein|uniref:peptide ABC transporter substrate-binding protein n=1 Tax=Enterococcus TaxID=1350 RepID=UPI0009BDD42C|nr:MULTISPECIES: peptide ABC transporter substrate-binding protein [Enterococcus]MBO0426658.1 peptide ABC transporter substrate-binding protein [Enterococcus faecium]MBZ0324492.1 peptide ABC transporter substrate-binding protein [Enterococcus casseliflavus]MCO5496009.1 peptide ABC transporter substrate-binding protein [Enterococcus innesii]MDO7872309.1 peptide ABC transporter substrate-binding protein [Enterococcus casseliflavus]MEB5919779.1 peptide ABC transporter substrate-binding protein [E